MNKAKRLVVAFAFVLVAAVGLSADQAAAHNADNNSVFGCAATVQGSNYLIDHSWWTDLSENTAHGRCMTHNIYTGHRRCYILTWWYPGQPNQYFTGSGYDDTIPCWFDEP